MFAQTCQKFHLKKKIRSAHKIFLYPNIKLKKVKPERHFISPNNMTYFYLFLAYNFPYFCEKYERNSLQ